jgi:ACS family hexuronate transporter-like MFS transporter
MFSRLRWIPVWLLFGGGMINYMDRSALSIAAPLMMRDLRLDTVQLGFIFSSFFAGYALFNFLGGYASDVIGPKRVFTVSMTIWSLFCGLTAAAVGFTSLMVVRVIFGFGEGPFSAAANKMVSNWFPRREIASAIGVANAGTPLGGALAGPLVGWIALNYGWRASFVVLAVLGLVWTSLWVTLAVERPDAHPRLNEPERAEIESDRGQEARQRTKLPLRFYLRQPAVLVTGFAFFGYGFILYFFLSWFPIYLTAAQHLSITTMSFVNVIPWLLGSVGLYVSGLVCDFLFRKTGDALFSRKLVLVTCLSLAGVSVAVSGLVAGVVSAVSLMALAIFFNYLSGTAYWAIIQDTVQGENVGGASGFVHLIANCAGIIGPAVTGLIVHSTGAFTGAFLLAGGVAILAAVLVAKFVKPLAAERSRYASGSG